MTVEDLKGEHKSNPQNPSLARLFYNIGFIERWGTGTNKMIELCEQNELPPPEFQEKANSFVVTFRKSKLTEERLEQLDLNERQKKAVEYLKEHDKITNSDYRDLNEVPRKTAKRDFTELVEKEILEQKGTGRNAHYTFPEK